MAERVYLSLGSNMGDSKAHMSFAVKRLSEQAGMTFLRKSSLYVTEPWGHVEQDDFLNAVVELETTCLPWELLAKCQQVEFDAGRERKVHWGPRVLDIDILWYGGQHISTGDLSVPHPYLSQRLYVMLPLAELEPQLEIPLRGRLDLLIAAHQEEERVDLLCPPDEW